MGINIHNQQRESDQIEEKTQLLARQLFDLLDKEDQSWENQVLDWCLANERLKYQILRFIDLLPSLPSPREVVRHLREYFPQPDQRLPMTLRAGIALTRPALLTAHLVSAITHWLVTRMGYRFIAGSTVEEASRVLQELVHRGMGYTLDILGEAVTSEREADQYLERYLNLIEELTEKRPDHPLNISLKLSSLYSQFDPIAPETTGRAVKERLRRILRLARKKGVFVNIDLEQYAYRDLTLRIFKELLEEREFQEYLRVGTVIQAYLVDAEKCLRELIDWTRRRGARIQIRLVKGAYWDYEVIRARQHGWPLPVFSQKWQTDANFERLTALLLKNHPLVSTAIASHNIRSIAHAMALAETWEIPPERLEFQMLYGMADDLKEALVRLGQTVRVYVPLGELIPGMAYLVRRILENTSNESFLRHRLLRDTPVEKLIENPLRDKGGPRTWEVKPSAKTGFQNWPFLDFSREENRSGLRRYLRHIKAQLGKRYPLIIQNRSVTTTETLTSHNPARTGEIVGVVAKAESDQAEQAIEAAQGALGGWASLPFEKRVDYLFKAASILAKRRMELAAWLIYEVGKNWREADAEVVEAIDYLNFYAHEMRRLGPVRRLAPLPGELNEYLYRPRGVGVIISPWNFPLAILTGMTTAAIVTGNTVIMKPAEQSPVIAAKLMEIFLEVGLPAGVVNYLPGRGEEIGEYLVKSPKVDFIAFTGSREIGLRINRLAAQADGEARTVKRVIAEMGGKNAIIIDTTADLDEAVLGTVQSAFGYQGQKCSAASRIIVLEDIYDQFLPRLIEATRSIKVGLPEEPDTMVGPLIDQEAYERVKGYIALGKKEARLALEIQVDDLPGDGYFIGPTIFTEVDPRSTLAQEEIFGPVLAVIKAKDFQQALQIANDVCYGLTGGLYSRTPSHIEQARQVLQVGNLYINRKITGAMVGRQPFGGFKLSGIGSKAGGPDYLLQFMQPQTITENTMRHGFAPLDVPEGEEQG